MAKRTKEHTALKLEENKKEQSENEKNEKRRRRLRNDPQKAWALRHEAARQRQSEAIAVASSRAVPGTYQASSSGVGL